MFNLQSYGSSSSGNCHILSSGDSRIMLDCGLPIKALRRNGVALSTLDGCLVSHSHLDHCKGAKDLLKLSCDVYMSEDTRLALKLDGHRCHLFQPLSEFKVGAFKVIAFPLIHDVINAGFLVCKGSERMVYVTDTAYCKYTFVGLTMIAIECNYTVEAIGSHHLPGGQRKRVINSHLGLRNVIKFLQANNLSKVKVIHALHLSDSNSDEALIKKAIQDATGIPCVVAAA